jgi:hypothetical protein
MESRSNAIRRTPSKLHTKTLLMAKHQAHHDASSRAQLYALPLDQNSLQYHDNVSQEHGHVRGTLVCISLVPAIAGLLAAEMP